MGIIHVVTIQSVSHSVFSIDVNEFLSKNEEMVFHEKTVYGITQEDYLDDKYGLRSKTVYSAIFQIEGERK